jgi:hypothetical protein
MKRVRDGNRKLAKRAWPLNQVLNGESVQLHDHRRTQAKSRTRSSRHINDFDHAVDLTQAISSFDPRDLVGG